MAYLEEVKKQVKEQLARGEKVKVISEQTGISIATLYKWKREEGGQEKQQQEKEVEKKLIIQETVQKEEEKLAVSFRERVKVNSINVETKGKETKGKFYEIMEFLKEGRKNIYVRMQSQNSRIQGIAISQWDKLESLIESVNVNRNNTEYLNILYDKISKLKQLRKEMDR